MKYLKKFNEKILNKQDIDIVEDILKDFCEENDINEYPIGVTIHPLNPCYFYFIRIIKIINCLLLLINIVLF